MKYCHGYHHCVPSGDERICIDCGFTYQQGTKKGGDVTDKHVIKAALSEAIAKREHETKQLIAELRAIEDEEKQQAEWFERQVREASDR